MVAAVLPRFTTTHIPGTRSSRVVLLLEELGLPYTIKDRVRKHVLSDFLIIVVFTSMMYSF
jgi:hypothetical protein